MQTIWNTYRRMKRNKIKSVQLTIINVTVIGPLFVPKK